MTLASTKFKTFVITALGLTLISEQLALPALAFKDSYGAITAYKKILSGIEGNDDDIAFSPILLDMAKVIGRAGLPPGFFLHNDNPFPDQPGIDLRTLLLYQAGLLKMPVRMQAPHKANPDIPTLAFPSLRQAPSGIRVHEESQVPTLNSVPLPGEPERNQVVSPKTQVGDPGKVSISTETEQVPQCAISFDPGSFQQQDRSPTTNSVDETAITANLPTPGMFIPRPSGLPFVTRSIFRLWTYRPSSNSTGSKTGQNEPYKGTFVVVSGTSFKGIAGRTFQMATGKLLASNQAGELKFKTDFAEISVEPESTALIELTPKGALRIRALESAPKTAIVIKAKVGDKAKTYNLAQGDELLLANRELQPDDFIGTSLTNQHKQEPFGARGTFSVTSIASKEALLKADSISNEEYRSAISELRHRLQIP